METRTRVFGEITIIDCVGRLDTGTSPVAESAINEVMEGGCSQLIINLAGTEYVSSSGLRVLLVTAKKISALKGKLKICAPNDVVREILDISGFSTILDVRNSEGEALAAMML
jgi:anti-sigma B factor antagonist